MTEHPQISLHFLPWDVLDIPEYYILLTKPLAMPAEAQMCVRRYVFGI